MTEPAFDELLRRLARAGAEFVVVGGLAVNAWGVIRGTKDIDIVVSRDPNNISRIAAVVVEAGGHVQRGDALLGTAFSISAEIASGDQVAVETRLGRLDIVQGLEGVPDFEQLRASAHRAEVLGVEVLVCSIEHLKEMKNAAGRTRDLADLEDLDAISE